MFKKTMLAAVSVAAMMTLSGCTVDAEDILDDLDGDYSYYPCGSYDAFQSCVAGYSMESACAAYGYGVDDPYDSYTECNGEYSYYAAPELKAVSAAFEKK